MLWRRLVIAQLALLPAANVWAESGNWPVLREVTEEFPIDFRGPYSLVRTKLLDVDGNAQYELACFSGGEVAVNELGGFVYTSGLQCGLDTIGTPVRALMEGSSLLSDPDERAYYSRGTFHPEEIVGACATYPDHGRIRAFRLRGFQLELRLVDVSVDEGYMGGSNFRERLIHDNDRNAIPIGRATLVVTVSQDSGATGESAEPSSYPDPKGQEEACVALEK